MGKKSKVSKPDVKVVTYGDKDKGGKTIISFYNGMDEFIECAYVNLTFGKGCLRFEKGNIDNGGVKMSHDKHSIQSSNSKLQTLFKEFNGYYPLHIDDDNVCYIILTDKQPLDEKDMRNAPNVSQKNDDWKPASLQPKSSNKATLTKSKTEISKEADTDVNDNVENIEMNIVENDNVKGNDVTVKHDVAESFDESITYNDSIDSKPESESIVKDDNKDSIKDNATVETVNYSDSKNANAEAINTMLNVILAETAKTNSVTHAKVTAYVDAIRALLE